MSAHFVYKSLLRVCYIFIDLLNPDVWNMKSQTDLQSDATFDFVTAALMKLQVCWVVPPC